MLVEELNRCAVETKVGAKHRFFKIPVQFGVKMLALLKFCQLVRDVPPIETP